MVNEECDHDCAEVMKELQKFERNYSEKVHEYELDKLRFANTLDGVANHVLSLERTTRDLAQALTFHMSEEEGHHIKVASALATIEASLKGTPTTKDVNDLKVDIETQKGRITTVWIIGGTVVMAALGLMAFIAVYVKDDIVDTIKDSKPGASSVVADIKSKGK